MARRTALAGGVNGDRADEEEPAAEMVQRLERQHVVRQSLRRLGGRCEQLLTALFLTPGQPRYETIAAELGMKVGSIGPTRARCFEKLEKILVEMGMSADGFPEPTYQQEAQAAPLGEPGGGSS